MAEASISVDQDQFSCPVCLDLLKDPVTLPCGHSFCKECINGCWDQEDQKGVYSCPQCRHTFTPRPVLHRNNMLTEVVEKLKKTELQAASPAHCYAGPGDVECDFCTGRKHKAVKSCLMCLTSFCETHLKPHLEISGLKKHTLIEASAELQEKICSEHNKLIEIYCRTDQTCICYLCMMDNHKGHDTVTAAAERAEKQSELKEEQMKSQERIQEKQKKVQELKQAVNTIKLSAQTAVEDSERIFTELISSMEKKRSEVTELIRAQEKAELSRAERLLEQLEQEIADLQRRVTELEQLSHTLDDIHFLQALASGRQSPTHDRPDFHASGIAFHQHLSFDGVRNSLSDLKKRLEEFCEEEFSKIPPQVEDVQILPSEPKRKGDFLKCEFNIWAITPEEREEHDKQFDLFTHTLGYVSGVQVRKFFLQSGLPVSILAKIWELADMGEDGKMDRLEFSIAMKLIKLQLQRHPLPTSLPIIMKQTPVPVMKSSECFGKLSARSVHVR
ncbi:hypothetical protein PHYPO_G00185140 [Pangasianodon hypophthalmus]|uniref:E3 ubiquitin/ISG15 ligase TRIM25-like n=1 Tax=Pangasianodon hypophthalmus TaxID=310915 RepID=A0A5N5JDL4_PANHP|nr:hypothetical protein PHYPO_G00185140 [Pangasianodon hypophthalmus]